MLYMHCLIYPQRQPNTTKLSLLQTRNLRLKEVKYLLKVTQLENGKRGNEPGQTFSKTVWFSPRVNFYPCHHPQRTFWKDYRHFWLSQLGEGYFLHVVSTGQGFSETSYRVQDSSLQLRSIQSKMPIEPWLRNCLEP